MKRRMENAHGSAPLTGAKRSGAESTAPQMQSPRSTPTLQTDYVAKSPQYTKSRRRHNKIGRRSLARTRCLRQSPAAGGKPRVRTMRIVVTARASGDDSSPGLFKPPVGCLVVYGHVVHPAGAGVGVAVESRRVGFDVQQGSAVEQIHLGQVQRRAFDAQQLHA